MFLYIIVAFCISLLIKTHRASASELDTSSCLEKLNKTNPELMNDLSKNELSFICDHIATWNRDVQAADMLRASAPGSLQAAPPGAGQPEPGQETGSENQLGSVASGFDKDELREPTPNQQDFFKSMSTSHGLKCDKNMPESQCAPGMPGMPGAAAPVPSSIRKEYRMLSDDERNRFHAALNVLKRKQSVDGVSIYDLYAKYHHPSSSPGAHWGASFLPFHRELLRQMEVNLKNVDSGISLPYWDSTLDDGLPTPEDSILWTEDFLGNGNGYVATGPFKWWIPTSPVSLPDGTKTDYLYRNIGFNSRRLFRDDIEDYVLSLNRFDQMTYCVNSAFESRHGSPHLFVGGHMYFPEISSNDPAFYLHHCFVDYLWERFRHERQSLAERESQYPDPVPQCASEHHNAEATMKPFAIRNVDGLANSYNDTISYEMRPTCSESELDCGSKYLWCQNVTETFHCRSKIRLWGNCRALHGQEPCYESKCNGWYCALQ